MTIGTPRRVAARLTVVATTAAVGLSACTGVNTPPEPFPPPSDGRSATLKVSRVTEDDEARGLASVVLDHLDPERVTGVSGAGGGGRQIVSIDLEETDLSSVYAFVSDDRYLAALGCGGDFGYRVVTCETGDGAVRELVVKRRPGCSGPVLMGRYEDDERGNVLLELFGRDTSSNRRLVLDLLDDRRLGAAVPVEAIWAGESIDMNDLVLTTSLEVVEEGDRPPRC